ncbi:hypothetical protein [Microbacterium sp. TNHR37B]|uniref:hypothetical protein n=1 Tax=Microbacterium sp. TNHR37B TaxID=1775956 RepID=UPI0007B2615E|nr:hypothetical protein [Microbacterium sp. TNHR37B]KZE89564.1 hypothetical protein AVP41_02362 [Microbacterium sp. TNHR37B]
MSRSDYLSFGGGSAAAGIDIAATLAYLRAEGRTAGYLTHARRAVESSRTRTFAFDPIGSNYCDFCFVKLMGGEFDRLADGRERCVRCSKTALRSSEEFEDVFAEVVRNVETSFDISLRVPMTVRMVNAKEIARRTDERFEPTPGVDARVLGFAAEHRDGYTLYVENGSPRLASVATIAHELTHIWQYRTWNARQIEQRYGRHHRLTVYEGMAAWAQVQYLLFLREHEHAERQEAYLRQRDDEYGVGFRLYADRYPLSRAGDVGLDTPFRHPFPL